MKGKWKDGKKNVERERWSPGRGQSVQDGIFNDREVPNTPKTKTFIKRIVHKGVRRKSKALCKEED